MSGFSPAMMKVLMGEGREDEEVLGDDTVMVDKQGEEIKPEPAPRKQEMMPLSIMIKTLGMASYNKLVVWTDSLSEPIPFAVLVLLL